jgi:hypothetical protein
MKDPTFITALLLGALLAAGTVATAHGASPSSQGAQLVSANRLAAVRSQVGVPASAHALPADGTRH